MRVFTSNDFTGHWPVGTAAVVVAEDKEAAKKLLTAKLKAEGLKFDGTLREINIHSTAEAIILNNGNY
jgi:hypothetical protein